MKKYLWMILLTLVSIIVFGCAIGTRVIKGSVIMRTPDEVHINLGAGDGLQIGDTLSVFRSVSSGRTKEQQLRIGTVKVVKLLNKNYSVVEVLEGAIMENDVVEKIR